MITMRIRDSHSTISGDKTEYAMPSGGIDIIADDGRPLFSISQSPTVGEIVISGGMVCMENDVLLDDKLIIIPRAANLVYIQRPKYKD